MPGMDGTGPMGYGPMTGGGRGYCGAGMRRNLRRGFGTGRGRGIGPGFGRRSMQNSGYWQDTEPLALNKEEQKKILEAELKDIEAEKQEIEQRLKEMQG